MEKMHFTGFPLPGLPFHCQHHTAPSWVHCASRNANHSFLHRCSTVPGPQPSCARKTCPGLQQRGRKEPQGTAEPQGGEQREPQLSALPRAAVTPQQPPQRVLYLPLAPSQQPPTPQKHQTNCKSRENNRNSGSTTSQTGPSQHRTCQQLHRGDTEPNTPTGSVLCCPSHQGRSWAGAAGLALQLQHHPADPHAAAVSAVSHSHAPAAEGICSCRSSSAPARIPCRHGRNTLEPSGITRALGHVPLAKGFQEL